MGLEREEIADLLAAETWYTTDEAIAAKLATATTASESKEAKVASWFRNAPAALLNKQEKPKTVCNLDYDLAVAAKKRFQMLSK